MRKIITFLGTKSRPARYSWQGKEYEGRLFTEVLREITEYDEMLVLATEDAAKTSWPILEELNDPRIHKIDVPTAKSPEDMWRIFTLVLEQVDERDHVIFDITHSLRYLPFLSFLFAAFLKTARDVKIEAIYYGALELSNENQAAPVIDLSEFITMLDWINATDQFIQTGDASRLADLLNPAEGNKRALKGASNLLKKISRAAFLCQPFDLRDASGKLSEVLKDAEKEYSISARPFSTLSQRVVDSFEPFSCSLPDSDFSLLVCEYQMIEWYYQHEQLIQAVTLAREWLIDAVTWRLSQPLDYTRENRMRIEQAISGLAKIGGPKDDEGLDKFSVSDLNRFGLELYQWGDRDLLRSLWEKLSYVRNRLDHAQHQKGEMKIERLFKKADEAHSLLQQLAKKWGITGQEPE